MTHQNSWLYRRKTGKKILTSKIYFVYECRKLQRAEEGPSFCLELSFKFRWEEEEEGGQWSYCWADLGFTTLASVYLFPWQNVFVQNANSICQELQRAAEGPSFCLRLSLPWWEEGRGSEEVLLSLDVMTLAQGEGIAIFFKGVVWHGGKIGETRCSDLKWFKYTNSFFGPKNMALWLWGV